MAAPEYWYTYAIELADTADQIYNASKRKSVAYYALEKGSITETHHRPLISRPVLLLFGLSLENLIKGLLISEDPKLLHDGKLNKQLIGHDLLKLAYRLKCFQPDMETKKLLKMLSDMIPYHGRYPVPRGAQDIKAERYINEEIYDACKTLFATLEMEFYRLNHKGIDAPEGVRLARLRLAHLDEKADFITDDVEEFIGQILNIKNINGLP